MRPMNKVQELILNNNRGWINLNLLNALCPNLREIQGLMRGSLKDFCEDTLKFVTDQPESKINKIYIAMLKEEMDQEEKDIFQEYAPSFFKQGWIFVEESNDPVIDKCARNIWNHYYGSIPFDNKKARELFMQTRTKGYYNKILRLKKVIHSMAGARYFIMYPNDNYQLAFIES